MNEKAGGVELKRALWWIRGGTNPILPPLPESEFERNCCMNPYVVRRDGEYWLYYAGADAAGHRRICLATAPVMDLTHWTRRGVVLDLGTPGAFDAHWTVLPHVVPFGRKWHLYYTGNCGHGEGLASFPGIGLAMSEDGLHFERYSDAPVLPVTGGVGDPDRYGIAGGSVISVGQPNGATEWRFHYTGCPSLGDDVFRNQQKIACLAVSRDGIRWERRGGILFRDPERDYVNVAAAGPVVWQEDNGSFRMIYSAIGTRWGYYSICYAESDDGITWRRGEHYGDDLTLGPTGDGWERQMVEYPAVIREGSRRRLFYCGNGYGGTGIGTALSCPLRALAVKGPSRVRLVAPEAGWEWDYRMPEGVTCDEGSFKVHTLPMVDWHGPTEQGMLWHEWTTDAAHYDAVSKDEFLKSLGIVFIQGLWFRTILYHREYGLEIVFTASNLSQRTFHNVTAFPCLGSRSREFHDDRMTNTFLCTGNGLTPMRATDRGTGDPVRTHFHVRGMRPMKSFGVPFWGEASATEAVNGMVLKTSADGRWTIGANWQTVAEIYHNEDAHHHCIHSVPTLGDLAPGEMKTVKGRIILVAGGAEEAVKRLECPAD